MKRLARCLVVALALAGVSGCGGDGGGRPVAGSLTISLTTPNPGADGAILFTVTGPQPLTNLTASTNLRAFSQALSATTKVAVTGPLANGAIVTVGVADVGQAAQYTATIQSVAASDFRLRSLTGYSLTVTP